MLRLVTVCALAAALIASTGCAGTRSAEGHFTAHATSFRLLGFPIPEDDLEAAVDLAEDEYPDGEIVTILSNPADWTSVTGILSQILGFTTTIVGGTTGE